MTIELTSRSVRTQGWCEKRWPTGSLSPRIAEYVSQTTPVTPCLILDLDVVAARYRALAKELPHADIYYAVKANPQPEVIALLARLGSCFDVASPAEVELCLRLGARPESLSYGNTTKKRSDIRFAFQRGVRLFAVDSCGEVEKIADEAPGSDVFCRILTSGQGAQWPLSRKFGCASDMAADLLLRARDLGLNPRGVSFHVGSQQGDVSQWGKALRRVRQVFDRAAAAGLNLDLINLGGGFPAQYVDKIPPIEVYGKAIRDALGARFPGGLPRLMVEPGRYIVGDAGVLFSEVILASRKAYEDDERWVYIDVGVFGGLAETLDEAIRYRIVTNGDENRSGPVVLAGPTCDSADIMYERNKYQLPLDLQPGDVLAMLSAGAYTSVYCSAAFNGFEPLPLHCIPVSEQPASADYLEEVC
ncbi:type III PLP-dependent enzyme [Mycobacterium angelicum]|nr:type III PLP-dependent enzyme [Mycobacterium angelicum]